MRRRWGLDPALGRNLHRDEAAKVCSESGYLSHGGIPCCSAATGLAQIRRVMEVLISWRHLRESNSDLEAQIMRWHSLTFTRHSWT